MRKMMISLLAVVLMIAFIPAGVFAGGKTVKSTLYEIYVSGNYAYTTGNNGLYKVKIKKGKPVSKKKIVKCGKNDAIDHIFVKGKYVYYKKSVNNSEKEYLYRVKKTGGKVKKLAAMGEFSEVAFKGNKIYYSYPGKTDENGKVLNTVKKVMSLNGAAKKDTSIEAVEKDKYFNKKGYKFKTKVKNDKISIYLKAPKGTILLEKF